MKKHEIVVGGRYTARVSGKSVVIRVTDIKEFDPHFNPNSYRQAATKTRYYGTNESTGRTVVFRSAQRFHARLGEPISNINFGSSAVRP